jgi:hypothetical protein
MTIPLTGSGSFGVRMGSLMGPAADIYALLGGTATTTVTQNLPTLIVGGVTPNYANGTPAPQAIQNLLAALAQYQQSGTQLISTLSQDAIYTLQVMYGIAYLGIPADAPLSSFQAIPIGQALQGLYTQMVNNTQTVQAQTVTAGAQTAVGTPVGNGVAVVSLFNGLGQALALPLPETLTITCTQDSYTGGRAVGNETLLVTGQPQQAKTSPLWPGGSACNVTVQAVNGATSNGQGNILQNSAFGTMTTANVPDNWTVVTGTPGTSIVDGGSGHAYATGNTHSLGIVGDGSTLTDITQQFNITPVATVGAGGTSFNLVPYPDNVLHLCAFMAMSATPAAGTYIFDLYNGSSVVQNDQGVNQTVTFSLTSLSTTFLAFKAAFQLPKSVPSTLYLRQRQGTAISSGKTLYVGQVSLAIARNSTITPPSGVGSMVQGLYAGGPFLTFHSGNIPLVNGLTPDQWTIAIANNYSTSGDGLFQQYLERWCNMSTLGLQLPTLASGATLLDTVIVS